MKLIHRYSSLKDVACLKYLAADFLCTRKDMNGHNHKCDVFLCCVMCALCFQTARVNKVIFHDNAAVLLNFRMGS